MPLWMAIAWTIIIVGAGIGVVLDDCTPLLLALGAMLIMVWGSYFELRDIKD